MTGAALLLTKEIARYRPVLYRLALLQLRDKTAADEATQETMLAALEGVDRLRGGASVKTWLFTILRYKVVDVLRLRGRYVPPPSEDLNAELDVTGFDALFDGEGRWSAPKNVWADPETVAERKAFFKALEACLTRLPATAARAFLMREWLEFAPEEVSAELNLSAGNLRVLLYRARMQLRACLDVGLSRA